jgi:hypothetical protein
LDSASPSQKPLEGEILPPEPPPLTHEELASFLTAHNVKVPRPKAYRSLKAALKGIIAAEAGSDGTG